MTYREKEMRQAVTRGLPVYCFYSADPGLLQQAAAKCLHALQDDDTEPPTVLDGPAPDLEEVVAAAGTISFFGTRRLVMLPGLKPGSYADKDLAALCDILASAENAVFVLTVPVTVEWNKLRLTKKEKQLFDLCEKLGYCAELAKPGRAELAGMLADRAKEQGAVLDKKTAYALIDRCGEDFLLLSNETDKLAALAGYGTITPQMVEQLACASLEANAFEMAQLLTEGKLSRALERLNILLAQQSEPVALLGALSLVYLDLYRLSCGMAAGRDVQQVHKDFKYKGSDYRLKKSLPAARALGTRRLRRCLAILEQTDRKLKSGGADKETQLQAAFVRLAQAEGRL